MKARRFIPAGFFYCGFRLRHGGGRAQRKNTS
jgi:hypothetical protein